MRLVVDASIAVKWFIREEYSDFAVRLLQGNHELHAPRLMASEVGNALWQKVRMGELESSRAGMLAADIAGIGVRWTEDEVVCPDAVRIALSLNRPVYDCVYLALAHRLGATLVTADVRFINALANTEHGGAVVALGSLVLE